MLINHTWPKSMDDLKPTRVRSDSPWIEIVLSLAKRKYWLILVARVGSVETNTKHTQFNHFIMSQEESYMRYQDQHPDQCRSYGDWRQLDRFLLSNTRFSSWSAENSERFRSALESRCHHRFTHTSREWSNTQWISINGGCRCNRTTASTKPWGMHRRSYSWLIRLCLENENLSIPPIFQTNNRIRIIGHGR